jgi:hypothetical protein
MCHANVYTVNRGGFAQGGVKLHRALTLNIFTGAIANPANCYVFYIILCNSS